MAANRQKDIHTHNFRKCSHASVGLAQARPNYTERKPKNEKRGRPGNEARIM